MPKKKQKTATCHKCGGCCNHIALQIDTPETKEDYEDIMWYLLHENVNVFIEDGDWYVEFITKCTALAKDKTCKVYATRPKICREYSPDSCIKNGSGSAEEIKFATREDLLKYIKKMKSRKNKAGKKERNKRLQP